MRLRQMIGLGIVLFILLFITASYVAYSQKMELFDQRGAWYVKAEGKVYLTGGEVYAVIDTFRAWFDSTPELLSYGEYLGSIFEVDSEKGQTIPDNQTFVKLRVVISYEGSDGFDGTILDDTQKIAYSWAGGSFGSDGQIGSFSYELGPYVAYHEFSPYKITCQVNVGTAKVLDTFYLTIPDLSEAPHTMGVTSGMIAKLIEDGA